MSKYEKKKSNNRNHRIRCWQFIDRLVFHKQYKSRKNNGNKHDCLFNLNNNNF